MKICYAEGLQKQVDPLQKETGGLYVADTHRALGPITFVPEGSADQRPLWSPDGRHIAYERVSANGQRRVYVVSADGREAKPLEVSARDERLVDWDASGTRLLVERRTRSSDDAAGLSTWLEKAL
jgi:dipeptidyl aminopeptidase/acylaminoacyl peptidase